jgi:catalase
MDNPQNGQTSSENGSGTAVNGVGSAQDQRTAGGENMQTLTTRQGHPVSNNQNLRTVGSRGPATLENYQFIEKISHFDRERIPERVVHARGAGAHGVFEAYGTVVLSYSTPRAKKPRCSCASRR